MNLLSNAVQATDAGVIEVSVRSAPEAGRAGQLRVSFAVRDPGRGIAPEDQARIFAPFEQAGAPETGTGLGLAIARSICAAMGGELSVESSGRAGEGSNFRFSIAVRPAGDRQGTEILERIGERSPAGLDPGTRVLVVDDEPANREVARAFLERLGLRSDEVGDGEAALRALEETTYDLVLLDVVMPGLDGLEVARRVRKRWPREEGPLLLGFSASADARTRASCLEAGMDDCLSKPIRLAALATALGTRFPGPPAPSRMC